MPVHPRLKALAHSLGIRRAPANEESAEPSALIGRDGWLFLTGDSNDVLGQHTGALSFGAEWRRDWARRLAARMEVMGKLGTDWTYLMAPDKESVYTDKLPADIELAERRPVHDFLDIAQACGAPVIYPLAELEAAKDAGPVYFQTDTHWTALGCHVAYRVICDRLALRGIELPILADDQIEWAETWGPGDLGSKLEPDVFGRGLSARVRAPRSKLVSDNRVRGTGRMCIYESDRADAPTAVILGTSFAPMTLCFFKESFRRLVFVHTSSHDERLLRRERPDVVITIRAERGLRFVTSDRATHRRLAKMAARKPATEGPLVEE